MRYINVYSIDELNEINKKKAIKKVKEQMQFEFELEMILEEIKYTMRYEHGIIIDDLHYDTDYHTFKFDFECDLTHLKVLEILKDTKYPELVNNMNLMLTLERRKAGYRSYLCENRFTHIDGEEFDLLYDLINEIDNYINSYFKDIIHAIRENAENDLRYYDSDEYAIVYANENNIMFANLEHDIIQIAITESE